jgi:hypothetical protein
MKITICWKISRTVIVSIERKKGNAIEVAKTVKRKNM